MTNEPIMSVSGNLTADPELRYTQEGVALCTFTVAQTPRAINRQTNAWEDSGETVFARITVWREMGEHVNASLRKGDRAMVTGRFVVKSWEDRQTGQKRTGWEIQADEVGTSLRHADAVPQRTPRDAAPAPQAPGQWGARPTPGQTEQWSDPAQQQQWTPPPASTTQSWPARTPGTEDPWAPGLRPGETPF